MGFYLGIQYQKTKIKELQVTIDQQQNQIANLAIGIRNSTPEGHQEYLVRLASTFKCEQYGRLPENYLYDKYSAQEGDTLEKIAVNILGDISLAPMIRRDNYDNVQLRKDGANPKPGEIINIRRTEYLKFYSISGFAGPIVETTSKSINISYDKDSFRNAYIYPTTKIELGPSNTALDVGDCVIFINDESLNRAILISNQDL